MLATISPNAYLAGSDETNDIVVTTDGQWLTYETNPDFLTFIPGAFNPDFLESLTIGISGDPNVHENMIVGQCVQAAPSGPCVFAPETTFIIPNPTDVPANTDTDAATFQVDIELKLLDALRALPKGNAIVPISAEAAALLAVEVPAQIAAAYLLKLPDGAPVATLEPLVIEGIMATLGIIGAVASSGDITINTGNHDDRVDLTAFDKESDVDLGTGNDTIILGQKNDQVSGGAGNDTFIHNLDGDGADQLDGGSGNDLLIIDVFEQSEAELDPTDPNPERTKLTFRSANTLEVDLFGQRTTYTLRDVEEIQLRTGAGYDAVEISGAHLFPGELHVDLGDGTDTLKLDDFNVNEVSLDRWFDVGQAEITLGDSSKSPIRFQNTEVVEMVGTARTTTINGIDDGDDISVFPSSILGETFTEVRIDDRAHLRLDIPNQLIVDALGGEDTVTVAIDRLAPTFETIKILGGRPSVGRLAAGDQVIVEGSIGRADEFVYDPGDSSDRATITLTNPFVKDYVIEIEEVEDIGLYGGESTSADPDDILIANATDGDDVVEYRPGVGEELGVFEVATAEDKFGAVSFSGIEKRTFNLLRGEDVLLVSSDELPGVNSGVTIDGGGTETTFTFGAPAVHATVLKHDDDQVDTLSLELGTTNDTVDITPGTGIKFALNTGEGSDFVTYHAERGAELLMDLDSTTASDDGTLAQRNNMVTLTQETAYGPVVMTGVERLNVNAGGQVMTVEHGLLPNDRGDDFRRTDSISDRLHVKPSGPNSGVLYLDAELQPNVSFHEVSQLNLHAQGGALLFEGTDLDEHINVLQTRQNTVDLLQRVAVATTPVEYVPVKAIGYHQAFVDGGRSVDTFRVDVAQCVADNTCPTGTHPAQNEDNVLAFSIHGGNGKDQMVVLDDDVGDTIIRREEVDEQSGFVKVGALRAVDYTEVEAVTLHPFDPVTGGTGDLEDDGNGNMVRYGREVILEADPLEPNDNRLAAHPIETLQGVNRDPNIGEPGLDLFGDQVLGDEDWVSFKATTTGTYRFFLIFDDVPTLENGQPGLPGDGNLDLKIYDASGQFIANGKPLDVLGTDIPNLTPDLMIDRPHIISQSVDQDGNRICDSGLRPDPRNPTECRQFGPAGEFVDIGIEEGTTVYARVNGHTPEAVNNYDLFVVSPLELADGTIVDKGRDSDVTDDPAVVSDPPGGGLRIRKVEINSFNPKDVTPPLPGQPDDGDPNAEDGDRPLKVSTDKNAERGDDPRLIFPPETNIRPTFNVESITVFLESFPPRAPGFLYEAIHETISLQPNHYELIGEHSGPITIDRITVFNDEVELHKTATGTVTLHFDDPLPDDRFTLVVKDTLVDPAIRPLDGETNTLAPVPDDNFKSGNGVPGGDFVGNFTVDTRVEIGTFFAGLFWVDLNQNGIYDPDNPNPLNRDAVYNFGSNPGLVDKPVIGDWDGDGFDELGLFARDATSGIYYFQLDRNGNGYFDPGPEDSDDPPRFTFTNNNSSVAEPVVGDWNQDGVDEVGLLASGQWLLDLDGSFGIDPSKELFDTNFSGIPFAGDWDGPTVGRDDTTVLHPNEVKVNERITMENQSKTPTGQAPLIEPGPANLGQLRLAVYDPVAGEFLFDMDGDLKYDESVPAFFQDMRIPFSVPGLERPFVGDFDADFDTNIGLLIANNEDPVPALVAEWLLDLGDPTKNPLMDLYDNDPDDRDMDPMGTDPPTDADNDPDNKDGKEDERFEGGSPGDGRFHPSPTGFPDRDIVYNDIFYKVSSALFAPFAGNFDLPSTRVFDPQAQTDVIDGIPDPPQSAMWNQSKPADVNNDGNVDNMDAIELAQFLGTYGSPLPVDVIQNDLGNPGPQFADADNNGVVDWSDYTFVAQAVVAAEGEGQNRSTNPVIHATEAGYFTNLFNRFDVNLDAEVTPVDILLIANAVNTHGVQTALDMAFEGYFLDTNGDNLISAADALQIINYMNEMRYADTDGEGESGVTMEFVSPNRSTLESTPLSVQADETAELTGGSINDGRSSTPLAGSSSAARIAEAIATGEASLTQRSAQDVRNRGPLQPLERQDLQPVAGPKRPSIESRESDPLASLLTDFNLDDELLASLADDIDEAWSRKL